MKIYDETLDPSEVKDFTADWSNKIPSGDSIVGLPVVAFVQASGATQPFAASVANGISRVWLTGGTHLARVIYTVRITTTLSRVLEESFSVDVIDNSVIVAAETDIERLTREITEAKAQRHNIALGNATVQVWRDGRGVRTTMTTIEQLEAYIRVLQGELVTAQVEAGVEVVTPRRRGIGLQWA